jgi:hypothetical protein
MLSNVFIGGIMEANSANMPIKCLFLMIYSRRYKNPNPAVSWDISGARRNQEQTDRIAQKKRDRHCR